MCLGIPGQVVEITDAAQQRVKVDVDGVRREVSVALLGLDGPGAARVGDWVLVHVGFAMARIDEAEARETLDALKQLGDMYEQELTDYSATVEGLDGPVVEGLDGPVAAGVDEAGRPASAAGPS